MMKDETNHHHSAASTSSSSGESEDESGSDSGTSTVTCASIHSRGGISSGSGLTSSSSGSSGWSSAGQAVYSPMKLTKRWRKTHEAESENNKLRYVEGESKMAVEGVSTSDQEEEEEEERSSYNALDLSCYGHGMDYSCSDSRSLEVVANWLDRNHHHALRAAGATGPLSPPTTPPTMFADMNESNTSIHRLSRGEEHLNGMGFLAPSPSASDSSNFSSSSSKLHHQQPGMVAGMMAGMVSSTQVMTPKSSPCSSPNTNGIKNSQGQNGCRSFGPLSAPSTSCSSSPSSNYRHLNTNNCNPSRPLFPPSSTCSSASLAATATANGYHPHLSGSSLDQNGSDQFSCLYLLASAAVSELERQRLHQSPSSPSNPATSNAAQNAVVHTLAVIS